MGEGRESLGEEKVGRGGRERRGRREGKRLVGEVEREKGWGRKERKGRGWSSLLLSTYSPRSL